MIPHLKEDGWDSASNLELKDGHKLKKPEILINKIEDKQIDEIIKFLEGEEKPAGISPCRSAETNDYH